MVNETRFVDEQGQVNIPGNKVNLESIVNDVKNHTANIKSIGRSNKRRYKTDVHTYTPIRWKNPQTGKTHTKWYPFVVAKGVEKLVKGEDYKIAICGQTGRGKSMKALRLAEIFHNEIGICHKKWNTKFQIYDILEFMETMIPGEGKHEGILKTFIFDEAAKTLSKDTYMAPMNRAMRKTLNLQRVRQNIYIFITPQFHELDVGIRPHIDVKVVSNNKKNASIYYNTKSFKEENKKDTYKWKYEKRGWTNVSLPDDSLIDDYQLKSGQAKNEQLINDYQKIYEKQNKDSGPSIF